MAENKKQNRWTITQQDVVNFRNEFLEDKFVDLPMIHLESIVEKHEVFSIELGGYGIIKISASSGRFTFTPFQWVADPSTVFSKRFFSKSSFMKVAEEFVTSHLQLKPAKKEEPKQEQKKPVKTQEPKTEKEHGKNALGHIKNSMADLLDKLFLEGVTEQELLEHGITRARYRSHFRHLENDKMELVQVKFENGKYSATLLN